MSERPTPVLRRGSKVLLGPSSFAVADSAPIRRLQEAGCDIVQNPHGRKLTADDLRDLLPGVSGLIAGVESLTRQILERSELRVISRCGSGLSNIDLGAARDLGIRVRSTPDAPTGAVAELTVGALISLMRQVPVMDRDVHEGRWTKRIGEGLAGKTVLLVGFGRIGRKVARLLAPFEVTLIAADPALTGAVEGVPVVALKEGVERADVISVHASGESEIIGDAEFAAMKRGVFLLNAARGAVVVEPALCRALEAGIVAGAWLDAFVEEPYAGPLTKYPNVILTPHAGSATSTCRRRMESEAVENLLAAFAEMPQEQPSVRHA